MSPILVEAIGIAAGILTTLCWLPQAWKIIRHKRTDGLSLTTQTAFTGGIVLWLIYGIELGSLAIILANSVTLVLSASILMLKLRYP